MPENPFANQAAGMNAPLSEIFEITPGTALKAVTRAIMVETESTVKVTTLAGTTITTLKLAPGVWHPIMVTAVVSGGTATKIHGGY